MGASSNSCFPASAECHLVEESEPPPLSKDWNLELLISPIQFFICGFQKRLVLELPGGEGFEKHICAWSHWRPSLGVRTWAFAFYCKGEGGSLVRIIWLQLTSLDPVLAHFLFIHSACPTSLLSVPGTFQHCPRSRNLPFLGPGFGTVFFFSDGS